MDKVMSVVEELNQQGRLLHSVGNYEAAIELYKKAEQEDPMYVQTYFNMGESYVLSDKFDEAKQVFSKVLLIDKKNATTYFHLGNVAFLEDDFEMGREYYAKAVNAGFDNAQLYYNLGTVYEERGDNEEAIKCYNKVIAKDKFRPDAKLNKAMIFIRENKVAEALQSLESIIEYTPDVFEGHHYKILLLVQEEKFEEAEKALEKALSLFPDDEGFRFDKVLFLEKQGNYDEAVALLNEIGEENRDVLLEKAKILLAQGKTEESVEAFETVKKSDGDDFDSEVRFYLFNIYINTGKFEDALKNCEEVIENGKGSMYYNAALYIKAEALRAMGREDEAVAAYNAAIKYFRMAGMSMPGHLDIYMYRALCHKAIKEYDKALEMANYLIAINADMGDAYMIRSEIYKELNENEKAEMDKKIAVSKSKILGKLFQ